MSDNIKINETSDSSGSNSSESQENNLTELETKRINEDLKILQEKFNLKIIKRLGSGGFSNIYLGIQEGNKYAIKMMHINPDFPEERRNKLYNWAKNEKIISMNLKNKNCIRCYQFYETKNSNFLFLELASQGDLSNLSQRFYAKKLFPINENVCSSSEWLLYMSESLVRFYFFQIVNALNYLKQMNFLHRDLKLENLLLTGRNEVKLTDFALSTNVPSKGDYELALVGTPVYMAPEIQDREIEFVNCTKAFGVDYYALGVILYKMLFGEFLIKANDAKGINLEELKTKLDDLKHNPDLKRGKNSFLSKDVHNLLMKLLDSDIDTRAEIKEITNHNWLNKKKDRINLLKNIYSGNTTRFLLELQKLDVYKCHDKLQIENKNKFNKKKVFSKEIYKYFSIKKKRT